MAKVPTVSVLLKYARLAVQSLLSLGKLALSRQPDILQQNRRCWHLRHQLGQHQDSPICIDLWPWLPYLVARLMADVPSLSGLLNYVRWAAQSPLEAGPEPPTQHNSEDPTIFARSPSIGRNLAKLVGGAELCSVGG